MLRTRHRIAAVRGAVNAVAALVLLRVHGPWAFIPAELVTLVGWSWPASPSAPSAPRPRPSARNATPGRPSRRC
jgi:hypothetical protein